jgi:hypothetical protein
MDEDKAIKPKQQASFLYAMKAAVWAFFGLRRKRDFETDDARLNPVHFIIAGILAAAVFIALLVSIVKFVVLK